MAAPAGAARRSPVPAGPGSAVQASGAATSTVSTRAEAARTPAARQGVLRFVTAEAFLAGTGPGTRAQRG
ncbi:hypothetical protein GCM10019016_121320 [Streptomyces prasinosporus]|uniref:Uncharacterized protein n=1 Tax=Streptomyces prasinosporus TaxID=68256 RepID=A0ABP6UC34_9ACTN